MRCRFKVYPAPKTTMSLEVFRQAIASRRQAEAQLDDAQKGQECKENGIRVTLDGVLQEGTDFQTPGSSEAQLTAIDSAEAPQQVIVNYIRKLIERHGTCIIIAELIAL